MNLSESLEINKHQIFYKTNIIEDFRDLQNQQYVLSLGTKSFDEILRGGFKSKKIYLIFGENKTGKTLLCHQLCVQSYLQFFKVYKKIKGKEEQFIFYFDTENTFRPERLKELITKYDMVDYRKFLKTILVSKIMSNSALFLSLKNLEDHLKMNHFNLLIIDTINNHYYSELADRNISTNKTKLLFLRILSKINELTRKFNLITILTAQVISNVIQIPSIRVIPFGYTLLNHFFSENLYLDNLSQDKRKCVHLVNSIYLPEKKSLYKITANGIEDYKI
ncbi:MAG: ATPase domain-containing protein [Candidatus Thorarchaeota archaeon]